MNQSLLEDLQDLQKNLFHQSKVEKIAEKYSPQQLIDFLLAQQSVKENFKLIIQMIQSILANHKHFLQFLLQKYKDQTIIGVLLINQDTQVRELVSECIDNNFYYFAEILVNLYINKNFDDLVLLLKVFFHQLSDPESEVGLKASRMTKKIFSRSQIEIHSQLKELIIQPLFCQMLLTGLQMNDAVIQLRFMEVAIEISNLDVQIQQEFIAQGVLTKAMKLYDTDDILVKLNIIELIQFMGNSEWNAKFLSQQKFFKEIIDTAMSNYSDFYESKYSVMLYCKLISKKVIKLDIPIQNKITTILISWIKSGNQEQIEGALEIFGNFAESQQGLKMLLSKNELMELYMKIFQTTNQVVKLKFICSLIGVFKPDEVGQKLEITVCHLFTQLSSNYYLQVIDLNQHQIDIGLVNNSAKKILNLLQTPISEIELMTLLLLKSFTTFYQIKIDLVIWASILKSFVTQDNFRTYLTSYAQNKEIFDLKKLVIKQILKTCAREDADQTYKNFAIQLNQDIQEKIYGRSDIMNVETEFQ